VVVATAVVTLTTTAVTDGDSGGSNGGLAPESRSQVPSMDWATMRGKASGSVRLQPSKATARCASSTVFAGSIGRLLLATSTPYSTTVVYICCIGIRSEALLIRR